MSFVIGRGFAEVKILIKVKLVLSLKHFLIFRYHFAYTFILTNSSPRFYQMSFFIQLGRDFAEVKINKKETGPVSLTVLIF